VPLATARLRAHTHGRSCCASTLAVSCASLLAAACTLAHDANLSQRVAGLRVAGQLAHKRVVKLHVLCGAWQGGVQAGGRTELTEPMRQASMGTPAARPATPQQLPATTHAAAHAANLQRARLDALGRRGRGHGRGRCGKGRRHEAAVEQVTRAAAHRRRQHAALVRVTRGGGSEAGDTTRRRSRGWARALVQHSERAHCDRCGGHVWRGRLSLISKVLACAATAASLDVTGTLFIKGVTSAGGHGRADHGCTGPRNTFTTADSPRGCLHLL
jgi:hypothetical protein